MRFINYLKDNLLNIFIYILTLLMLFILVYFFSGLYASFLISFIVFLSGCSILILNFVQKSSFYNMILDNLSKLDKKYLILETIEKPRNREEKLMVDMIYDINKSMVDNINIHVNNINEFKEFMEIWIHEVKIPISSLVLKCHNSNDKKYKDLLSIIRKLDNLIDTILYYVRSEDVEKDFLINRINLKEVVKNVALKNKKDLLENDICFKMSVNNLFINTDKKWIEFIINQIVNNSIKYKKGKCPKIEISSYEDNGKVSLCIFDNGIGIPKGDISRIFDKSFTGSNGRKNIKSTGMGLYIVKKLCNKLGHNIYVQSEVNKFTKIIIEFGKNDIYEL